jgi:ribosomal protein S12 methylthiotransferase accessory factor
MQMDISFPGGKKVNSTYKGFTVATDQPKDEGGDGTAPEPYDLVLSALGTCAGVYVLYFCEEREIDTAGIKMTLHAEKNETTHLFEEIRIQIDLPPGFPKKYKAAVVRAAELCTVKRSFANPPNFTVVASIQT